MRSSAFIPLNVIKVIETGPCTKIAEIDTKNNTFKIMKERDHLEDQEISETILNFDLY
jgi:hypothetical protein